MRYSRVLFFSENDILSELETKKTFTLTKTIQSQSCRRQIMATGLHALKKTLTKGRKRGVLLASKQPAFFGMW